MKKHAFIFVIILTFSTLSVYAQFDLSEPQLDVFSGYGRTMYDLEHHSQAGYIPLGARITVGEDMVKLGLEVNTNVYSPTFVLKHPFTENEAFKEKYRSGYLGAFGRFYLVEDFLFVRGGAGVHFLNHKKYLFTDTYKDIEPYLTDDDETLNYKTTYGINVGAGVSIGEESRLIATIMYNYKKNTMQDDEDISFNASSISLVLAFSIGN